MKDQRSLWISDVPADVTVDTLARVLRDELGLSKVRAREHATNITSGSAARIYPDDAATMDRMRVIFGRLGCQLQEALESQAS